MFYRLPKSGIPMWLNGPAKGLEALDTPAEPEDAAFSPAQPESTVDEEDE